MKFKGSVDIDQSRAIVTQLFANPNYLKEYQEGFVKKELVSGMAGKDGAISKMLYQNGRHKIELTETIISNLLPDKFEAFYHHKHMDNTMKCRFTELGENKTRYEREIEYTRINWILPRLFAIFFPGMYRKPAQKWMNNFKTFAEKN